ncbi:hypothetical protein P5E37_22975 [Vibrio parahaemolyticus]|nr:hypothetical protein [Vibrio parahaemolyticus]
MSSYITSFTRDMVDNFSFSDHILKEFDSRDYEFIRSDILNVDLDLVVGTDHPDYEGKTWGELIPIEGDKYHTLKRGERALKQLQENPDYYLEDKNNSDWKFHLVNGEFYICSTNHRVVTAKAFFEANHLPPIIKNAHVSFYRRKIDSDSIANSIRDEQDTKSSITSYLKTTEFKVILALCVLAYFFF